MKMLSFYKWIAGSMTDFTSQFKNNEANCGGSCVDCDGEDCQ